MSNYLQVGDDGANGQCRYCKAMALYTSFTCDNCGHRLAWADGAASERGEKCPNCEEFNVYAKQKCVKCGELLPWKDCAAAKYNASHNSDKEFRFDTISLLVGGIIFVFGVLGVLWTVMPH